MKLIKWGALSIFCAFCLLSPYSASAKYQLSPLTYKFEANPGDSIIAKLNVKNLSDTALAYTTETEDISSVSEDGAPSFAGTEDKVSGLLTLADWVTFGADNQGSVDPGSEKKINFTINVPATAEPGGHYAAIFVRETPGQQSGKTSVGVNTRLGALVLVTIPGTFVKTAVVTPAATPKIIWRGPLDFSLKVKNTGTIHYDSSAKVELKSLLGSATTVDMGTHTVLPGSTRAYSGQWTKRFPFGRYLITTSATDGDGQALATKSVIWAIPLMIVIPALIVLAVIILTVVYIKRHVKLVVQ